MYERRGEIQWLRAVAAFEVVVVHSDLTTKHIADGTVLQGWYTHFAGIGIELFFVVSGFIMCMVAGRARSAARFMLDRIRRILPLCALSVSLALLIQLAFRDYLIAPAALTPGYVLRSYLALPQRPFPLLGPTWTLEHEMIFYEIVAAALLLGAMTRLRRWLLGATVVGLGCLGCWLGPDPNVPVWAAHVASPYMLAFGFGWLLRCHEVGEGRERLMIGVFCVGAFLAAVVLGPAWSDRLALRTGLVALLFLAVVQARHALSADRAINRAAWRLGDASFSLYLSHWFVLSGCGKLAGALEVPEAWALPLRAGIVLLAVAVGLLVYQWIEMPLDRALRGMAPGQDPAPGPGPASDHGLAGGLGAPLPLRVLPRPAPAEGPVDLGRIGAAQAEPLPGARFGGGIGP